MERDCVTLYTDLNKIMLYGSFAEDRIIKKAMLLQGNNEDPEISGRRRYIGYELCRELLIEAGKRNLSGDIWRSYLLDLIISDENPFSAACEKGLVEKKDSLYNFALHDFNIMLSLYNLDIFELMDVGAELCGSMKSFKNTTKKDELTYKEIEALSCVLSQAKEAEEIVDSFVDFYSAWGCGKFAKYSAFRFEKAAGLVGISNPEEVSFEDLIGIDIQKQALIKNTEAFLAGAPANNVLLYGDRGTGKSSSVKALLNMYKCRGLRIIEITRHDISCFYDALEKVKDRGLHFIIFLDDPSFEDFETDYKYLKSVIEGGIEGRSDNVLIYATSNRRHIIKESWKDRDNGGEDINTGESLQEKLSLVDRFGESIIFTSPDKLEYLRIVEELAARSCLDIPEEELRSQALKWEMWHNGRSGRTAQHFINYLVSQGK